jgi:hypothetical protein
MQFPPPPLFAPLQANNIGWSAGGRLRAISAAVNAWRCRIRQRRWLMNSEPRVQAELFAQGHELDQEVAKPFWRS